MPKLIKVPGKRPGSYAYLYEGYSYVLDKRATKKKKTYRCSKKSGINKCTAKLTRDMNGAIQVTKHNHKAEVFLAEKRKLIQKMIKKAKETSLNVKSIFDEICRSNPIVGKHLSFRTLRNRLERARAELRPKLPQSLLELHDVLKDYQPLKGFYHGLIKANGSYGLIFSSTTLLSELGKALQLFIDGTFSVVPKVPKIMQLYSIHIRVKDVGIAAVFLLTEKRTTGLYKAMWTKLFKLVPTLQEKVTLIMSDYERAAITAARRSFPNARLCGCWFHYCQALLRRWKKLGLANCRREVLWNSMNLALAPATYFKDGLALIHVKADTSVEEFPAIRTFLIYLQETWAPIAEQVSVYGCAIRTNNLVETFHSKAKGKLGGVHPNLWMFLDKLKEVILDQEINLARLEECENVCRPRLKQSRIRDSTIHQKQKDLVSGRITLEKFLELFQEIHLQTPADTVSL